jgi:hypothetical protein
MHDPDRLVVALPIHVVEPLPGLPERAAGQEQYRNEEQQPFSHDVSLLILSIPLLKTENKLP